MAACCTRWYLGGRDAFGLEGDPALLLVDRALVVERAATNDIVRVRVRVGLGLGGKN